MQCIEDTLLIDRLRIIPSMISLNIHLALSLSHPLSIQFHIAQVQLCVIDGWVCVSTMRTLVCIYFYWLLSNVFSNGKGRCSNADTNWDFVGCSCPFRHFNETTQINIASWIRNNTTNIVLISVKIFILFFDCTQKKCSFHMNFMCMIITDQKFWQTDCNTYSWSVASPSCFIACFQHLL